MCGICGYRIIKNSGADSKTINKMCKVLVNRGPDQLGVYDDRKVVLGHTRLSIIDLKSGKQPIHNEDKTVWIVYNGECYNFKELRKGLAEKKHRFYTGSDTEVLVHLYEEYGIEFLGKIDGMFSLCIYDKNKKMLILARDRFGKKPLYYSETESSFVFASEAKALIKHPDVKKRIDEESLRKYFFYGFIPAPDTIFKDIKKLEAGHYLIFKNKAKIERYWDLDFSEKENLSFNEVLEKTDSLIKESVRKRLISDVPLGVFLSGGVDSSLVVSYMKELLGPERVKAFSIGFREKKFDESKYAKLVAEYLGVQHSLETFEEKDCLEAINEIYNYLDEPISDPSIIPTYLLSKFTKHGVTVSLSGDGGDELFLGYPKYKVSKTLDNIFIKTLVLNNFFINIMSSVFSFNFVPEKFRQFAKGLKHPSHVRNQVWISPFNLEELSVLFDTESLKGIYHFIDRHHNNFHGSNVAEESSYLDVKLTLQDMYLVKVDRASMSNSLEVRCPFLDKDLAEFSARIDAKHKFRGNMLKAVLKKIAEKRIPKHAIYRKKKGFGMPVSRWIKGELKDDISFYLGEERVREQGIFNYSYVDRILKEHLEGKADNSMKIWSIYVFQLWYGRWMENGIS